MPDGLPLLLVHGFSLCREAWRAQIDALASSCRVVAPDLRGFGEAGDRRRSRPDGPFRRGPRALLKRLDTGPRWWPGTDGARPGLRPPLPRMLKAGVGRHRAGADTPGRRGRRATAEGEGRGSRSWSTMVPKDVPPAGWPAGCGLMESATVEGVVGALLGGGRGRIRRRRWGIRVHLVVTGRRRDHPRRSPGAWPGASPAPAWR